MTNLEEVIARLAVETDETAQKAILIEKLAQALGPTNLDITGPHAYDIGLSLANQQRARWERLLSFCQMPTRRNSAHINRLTHVQQALIESLDSSPTRTSEGANVRSSLPIISEDIDDSTLRLAQRFPLHAIAFIVQKSAVALEQDENAITFDLLAANASSEVRALSESTYRKDTIEIEKQVKNCVSKFEAAIAQANKRFAATEEELVDAKERAQATGGLIEKNLREWEEDKDRVFESIKAQVSEYLKIEASIDLWRKKANWHTGAYAIFGLAFASALIAIVFVVVNFGGKYIEGLVSLPSDKQFFGLALLAIPTLAAAWLLRFVGRIAIQSLSLAQDARQRHAQITTYLRLLADNKITEKERILALAALFRPLPGQGTDDVTPPTVADILRDAQDQLLKPRS